VGIRKPKSRAEQTEENGRRLLDAARKVFTTRGYHATTLDQIAHSAGLTKGAVYTRFDSKADLMLALLAERIESRVAEVRALAEPNSVADAADDVFRQWLSRSRDADWTLLVLELRIAAARDRQLNARYAALHQRVIDSVAAHLERGAKASGLVLEQPATLVTQIGLALSNGLLLERAVTDDVAGLDAAVREANKALAAALMPFDTSPRSKKERKRS
jgi:AcrR family transcriptional regulator